MPINYEIKSQLAKLLATEDIIVENRNVSTAQFNVETRVLTLPMWRRASNSVYDMLVGHEVGHALFTPNEDPPSNIPHQFINVTEDARIEKLMKRRYPGLSKSFFAGYRELSDDDFFCIADEDVSSMNLADKVNLYFKIGNFIDIPFTEKEIEIRDLISNTETFGDVIIAAEILYKYCKEGEAQKKVADVDMPSNQGAKSSNSEQQQENGEEQVDSNISEDESEEKGEGGQPDEQTENSEQSEIDIHSSPEPEVSTDNIFNERTREFNGHNNGVENGYFDLPNIDLNKFIISNETVHQELSGCWNLQGTPMKDNNGDVHVSYFTFADSQYQQFKKTAQREVNYLVKEFECKKSADAYARAATSKTGVLDCGKLHTYRFNEDLFKKVTILPDGQNHGLIFILDWSGSMANEILDTVKQIYNLIWFCQKVNIPYDLYCFTNSYHSIVRDELNPEDANHFVVRDFKLLNLLTSGLKKKTLDEQMLSVWRLVFGIRQYVDYYTPAGYGLSGTPLNQAIACLYEMIPQFKEKHNLQKVQVVILTDGEANVLPVCRERGNLSDSEKGLYAAYPTPINSYLRSRKNGHLYQLKYEYTAFTDILLEDLKRTFPETNFIGFRLVDNRSIRNFISKYENVDDKKVRSIKKDKFYAIKNSGYSSYFAMTTNSLSTDTDFDVDEGATKAQIKSAFAKNLKAKALNKKVLSQFMDLVC